MPKFRGCAIFRTLAIRKRYHNLVPRVSHLTSLMIRSELLGMLLGTVRRATLGTRLKVSLKIIMFSMETSSWSLSEGLQHGGRKPVETSGVYFGSLKTFILSCKLENICIRTSLNILVTQNSETSGQSIFSCTLHVT